MDHWPFCHFRDAIAADGAPLRKDDEASAWFVSFINAGKHIQSENDNFLIFGANSSESHKSTQHSARKLMILPILKARHTIFKGFVAGLQLS